MFLEELGFKQEKHSGNQFISFLFTGWGLREDEIQRDAMRYLMKDGTILSTPEGRLYLSESKLKASGFNRGTS